jgi:hypothetical protein
MNRVSTIGLGATIIVLPSSIVYSFLASRETGVSAPERRERKERITV